MGHRKCADSPEPSLLPDTVWMYSKICLKRPLKKKSKHWFQDRLSLNAGQKYFRREHTAILSSIIKLPFVLKTFFEWPLNTGITVGDDSAQHLAH